MSERDVCEMGQLEKYYANNGKRIKHIVNQILKQFGGISQKDLDDFYSVANETFVIALKTWDKDKDFDAFVYTCIKRKILTEITRRNRQKRQADVNTVSLDGSNNSEQPNTTLEIASDFDVWNEVTKHQFQNEGMERYLHQLSKLQRKVLFMMADEYKPEEIEYVLHLSHTQLLDCVAGIRSYTNVSILL